MKVFGQYTPLFLLLLICGCSKTFEVEKRQVAIVISPSLNYENKVFKEGSHRVGADDEALFFDLHSTKLDFNFDFLYRNARSGHMDFALTYSPVPDSVYKFYEQYQVDKVDLVVHAEVKAIVRSLVETFDPGELTDDQVLEKLTSVMESKEHKLLNYVTIERIEGFNVR